MMGHKEKLVNGDEMDCSGRPGHRWRDLFKSKNPGVWAKVKNKINRRARKMNKALCKIDV